MDRLFVNLLFLAFIIVSVLIVYKKIYIKAAITICSFLVISLFFFAATENAILSIAVSLLSVSVFVILKKQICKLFKENRVFTVLMVDYENKELTISDFRRILKISYSDSQRIKEGAVIVIKNANLL